MEQAIFIVWRESVEALLVIGILYAWLRQHDRSALGYLYGGVAAGVVLALVLAAGLLGVQQLLGDPWQELFGVAMLFMAAALIVHMAFWMRRRGRTLGRDLQTSSQQALAGGNGWALALLACLAVGREGAETVIFLFGMSHLQHSLQDWLQFLFAIAVGVGLAVITWLLLQGGRRWLSWRHFFRLSEALLLLLAGALVVGGTDRLIGMGLLPAGVDPLWDTSALLDDSSRLGGVVAALTGYRAYPALTTVIVFAGFWLLMAGMLRQSERQANV